MSTPNTPKRYTRNSHTDCLKSPHQSKAKSKPAKAPKPKHTTPKPKPNMAPFDVKAIVSKLNNKNAKNGVAPEESSDGELLVNANSKSNDEPDSATIEVSDDLKSNNPMEVDEIETTSVDNPKIPIPPPLPKLEIPQNVRDAVGPNWRLKESVLNSYTFGPPSIRPIDFARSKLDDKTAEIIRNPMFSEEAKKYSVKRFLGELIKIRFNASYNPVFFSQLQFMAS